MRGSVANTMAASEGPASSSGPCRNWAVCRDSAGNLAASLSVSAPISAAARAVPRPSSASVGRSPSHCSTIDANTSVCSSSPSSAVAPCSISAAERPQTAASMASDPANVMVDGPYSSPARVSRATVAASASVFRPPLVIETSSGGEGRAVRRSASRTSSALSPDWLTAITIPSVGTAGRRKWRSSAESTIETGAPRPASSVTAA